MRKGDTVVLVGNLSLIIVILMFLLIVLIIIKTIKNKSVPDNSYTPFDYIAGQNTIEFHDEIEVREDEDQGDDLDKNHNKKTRK
ncbi:DUF3951 domain-containing protein [Aquibacillus rhizosphaerae]|uniref:DUF3951 domain-containing protein n=1 Tax=Aquibacillus rhizosphaerae TaxID=3051431 RepID=A0ABT7LCN6_9BACI|nr:DUF3951 domain-containing protein [Aquibacillus sp. LR5S19]MDL4843022.1 DUF3951 domain-containing protein [Aquibacillus sp. LR5S19]